MVSACPLTRQDNVRWMMSVARDVNQPINTRRRAVQYAFKGGTALVELVKFYDETTDMQLKDALLQRQKESADSTRHAPVNEKTIKDSLARSAQDLFKGFFGKKPKPTPAPEDSTP